MADSGNVIGAVKVLIIGDYSGLRSDFAQAQAVAQAAGQKVGQAFSSGASGISQSTQLVDQFGRTLQSTVAPGAAAASTQLRVMEGSLVAVGRAGNVAAAGAKNLAGQTQSVVGLIPGLGRAAENFINLIPGFGQLILKAFPVLGAVALAQSIFYIGKNLVEMAEKFDPVLRAEKEAEEGAKKWAEELNKVAKTLTDIQDKNFEDAVGKSAAEAAKAATAQRSILADRVKILAIEGQITEQEEIRARAARSPVAGGAAQGGADFITARRAQAAPIILKQLRRDLDAAQLQLASDTEAAARKSIESLQEDQKEREKQGKAAVSAARTVAEQLRANDDEELADLRSKHQVTIGETISFWKQRLAAETGNAQRVREINRTLGTLYQEQFNLFDRIAKRSEQVQEEAARKSEKQQSFLSQMAVEAEDLGNRIASESNRAAAALASAGARGAGRLSDIRLQGRGLEVQRRISENPAATLEQQIDFERELNTIEAQRSQNRIRELQAQKSIAESQQDALASSEIEQQIQAEIAEEKNRQYQAQTRINQLDRGRQFRQALQTVGAGIPGQLGGALASGVIGGQIGQQIKGALAGIGQQLLGTVLKEAITQLVISLGLNTAVNAALQILFETHASITAAQTTATVANTAAVAANTAALGGSAAASIAGGSGGGIFGKVFGKVIKSIAGVFGLGGLFADGGRPPVGMASIVGERGPELFVPDRAGTIIPAGQFSQVTPSELQTSASSTAYGGNIFHVYGANNPREAARQIAGYLKNSSPSFSRYSR